MTFRPIPILFISFISLTFSSFGQIQKTEGQLKNYLTHLKTSKVDTILIIESGCSGCEIKYSDTSKSVSSGQTTYVLTQHRGQLRIVSFDDFNRQRNYLVDTCSLFDTIQHYKPVLQQKDGFYKKELAELKKVKFYPPRPIHYNYDDLTIQLPLFNYNFQLVNNEFDYLGFSRDKEKWFMATKKIMELFFTLLNTSRSTN